jgi:DDE superfamily endonuclease
MLNLERILNQDRLIRAMTGLNRKAFEELFPSFTDIYRQNQFSQRAPGGGRKATLRTMTEKLLYVLLYCKRPGRVHDKRQSDEQEVVGNIPEKVPIEGDLGFQGLQNKFENIHLPHKKPKGKELTEQQKQENREFSAQRVKCEHAHGGIKRYNAVKAIASSRLLCDRIDLRLLDDRLATSDLLD